MLLFVVKQNAVCSHLLFTTWHVMVSLLVQGNPAAIIGTIQAKLIKTLLANYALWPLAHIINFKFIPSSQRILYINCVQV